MMCDSATPRAVFAIASGARSPWISWTARCGGFSPRSTIARDRAPYAKNSSVVSRRTRYREAAGHEAFTGLRRRGEKAQFRAPRPGCGVSGAAAGSLRDLGKHEPCARPQHAVDLSIEAGFVGDVHRHIHRVGAIEAGVREPHRQRVTLLEGHPVSKAEQAGQMQRDLAELRGQVDPGDPGLKSVGHVAGGAADPAADIEQVIARRHSHHVRDLRRGLEAAAMELVVGRQGLDRRAVRIDAVIQQCLT